MYLEESQLGSCQRLCQIHLLDAMYLKEIIERFQRLRSNRMIEDHPCGVMSTSMSDTFTGMQCI
jgi:hypothetical protein